MFKILAVTTLALLTSCATNLAAIGSYPAYDDHRLAFWAMNSQGFQMRTSHLENYPGTTKAMLESCARNVRVTVIVPFTDAKLAQALAGSCVQVYLSDYPEMASSSTVVIMDMDTLIANGNIVDVRGNEVRREHRNQQILKANASRLF